MLDAESDLEPIDYDPVRVARYMRAVSLRSIGYAAGIAADEDADPSLRIRACALIASTGWSSAPKDPTTLIAIQGAGAQAAVATMDAGRVQLLMARLRGEPVPKPSLLD